MTSAKIFLVSTIANNMTIAPVIINIIIKKSFAKKFKVILGVYEKSIDFFLI